MTDIMTTDEIFFGRTELDKTRLETIITDALHKADDGELFMEYNQSEAFVFDDGRLKNASFDSMQGFGLRACLLYTSPSPRDQRGSRMPSSA